MSGFSAGSPIKVVSQYNGPALSHTGDTTETTLATVTLPPMGANDVLRIETVWTHLSSGGTWTPKVKLGATLVSGGAALTAGTSAAYFEQSVRNRGATNSQVLLAPATAGPVAGTSAAIVTAAEETNAGATVTITGTVAVGTDTIKLEAYRITILKG